MIRGLSAPCASISEERSQIHDPCHVPFGPGNAIAGPDRSLGTPDIVLDMCSVLIRSWTSARGFPTRNISSPSPRIEIFFRPDFRRHSAEQRSDDLAGIPEIGEGLVRLFEVRTQHAAPHLCGGGNCELEITEANRRCYC